MNIFFSLFALFALFSCFFLLLSRVFLALFSPSLSLSLSALSFLSFLAQISEVFLLPSFDLASSIFGVFKQKLKLICLLFALSFFVLTENSDECAKSRAVSHIIVSSSHEAAVCVCVCVRERERESKREQKRAKESVVCV